MPKEKNWRILSIKMHGFKKMPLTKFTKFEMVFDKPMQFILGTNGSGKSRFLRELVKLTPDSADYDKNGYKEILIEGGLGIFKIYSTFSPFKHYFELNGEELNKGGNSTSHKELVDLYFGINSFIENLLLGKESFTQMSPSVKKEWLLKLSDVDYTYAINCFKYIREKYRDTVGVINHISKRLENETSGLLTDDKLTNINNEIVELQNNLDLLMPMRYSNNGSDISKKELDNKLNAISVILNEMAKKLTCVSKHGFKNRDELLPNTLNYLEQVKLKINTLETLRDETYSKLIKVKKDLNTLQNIYNKDTQERCGNIDNLYIKYNSITESSLMEYSENVNNRDLYINLINKFSDVKANLLIILNELPVNKNKYFNSDDLSKTINNERELSSKIKELTLKQNELLLEKKELEFHKNNPNAKCPECHNVFSINYTEDKYKKCLDNLNLINDKINNANTTLNTYKDYIDKCNAYKLVLRDFYLFKKVTPEFTLLLNAIENDSRFKEAPTELIDILNSMDLVLNKYNEKLLTKIQIFNLEKTNLELSKLGESNITVLEQSENELSFRYSSICDELHVLNKLKINYISYINACNEINVLNEKYNVMKADYMVSLDKLIEQMKIDMATRLINDIQIELGKRKLVLNNNSKKLIAVNEITNDLYNLKKQNEIYSIILKALSPKDGIIANNMNGFINHFVQQMNNIISQIWTYDLEILPCVISEDSGMSYIFGARIANDVIVKDIKELSSGQIEIIDLCFKITAMRYFNVSGNLLILDEFGRNFDHAHRNMVDNIIIKLMDNKIFSQLAMVSHNEKSYSTFREANFCVIDKTNIVIPDYMEVNKNLNIE